MMAIEEKLGKTLVELGVSDAAGVQALIAEVIDAMNGERGKLTGSLPSDPARWQSAAKELRDRGLARKNEFLSQIDASCLKSAPNPLNPSVGRELNRLREIVTQAM